MLVVDAKKLGAKFVDKKGKEATPKNDKQLVLKSYRDLKAEDPKQIIAVI